MWKTPSHSAQTALLGLILCSPLAHASTCTPDTFSAIDNNVLSAYVAYYGRPADAAGLRYWSGRMSSEGSLNSIMEDFGTSQEFNDRFGGRTHEQLVSGIYHQLFGRSPEPGGLDYYAAELASGRRSLQSIALDVMFGAQGDDARVIEQRLTAARHFTIMAEMQDADPARFDAGAMSSVLASVDTSPESSDRACTNFDAMLSALGGMAYSKHLTVSTTTDSNNAWCRDTCSLRDAVNEANSTNGPVLINLPSGVYTLTHPEGDLFISGNIHLNGDGTESTIIDGNGQTRIFWLEQPTAQLTLSNLALRNGLHDFGGAILNKGLLTLDRVSIHDNISTFNGGALMNAGKLHSFSTHFIANTASGSGFGGGLVHESGEAHLYLNTFFENHASHSGGAIFNQSLLFVNDTVFVKNTAAINGGGIETTGPVHVARSSFDANTADDGGAISLHEGGVLTAYTTNFNDNLAIGLDLGGGGAIFSYFGNIELNNTRFIKNVADGEGGGAIQNRGRLVIRDSDFLNNTARMHDTPLLDSADGFGGAILVIEGSHVDISGSLFKNNDAGNSGGGIYNDRFTSLTIRNSSLEYNTARGLFIRGAGGYGGGIHNEGFLHIEDSVLSFNSAKEAGGAISLNQSADVSAVRTDITDNTASNGGGIAAYTGKLYTSNALIARNTATKAGGFGGGILVGASDNLLEDTHVRNNHAAVGGAFSINSGGTVRVFRSTIEHNTANDDGSAFINFSGGRVELLDSMITGTYRNHHGSTFVDQGGNTYRP